MYTVRRINYVDCAPEKQLRVSKLKSLKSCAAYLIFQTVRGCSNTLNYWFVQNVIWSFVPSATCLQDASNSIGYSHSPTEGRWYQLRLHYPLHVYCPGLMCTSALLEMVTNHICVDSRYTSVQLIHMYKPVHAFDKFLCVYNMSPASVQPKQVISCCFQDFKNKILP